MAPKDNIERRLQTLDEFSTAFDSFGGELIETELDEDDVKVIHKALQKLQKV